MALEFMNNDELQELDQLAKSIIRGHDIIRYDDFVDVLENEHVSEQEKRVLKEYYWEYIRS